MVLNDEKHLEERLGRYFRWIHLLPTEDSSVRATLEQCLLEGFVQEPSAFKDFLLEFEQEIRKTRSDILAKRYLDVLSPLAEYFGMFREKQKMDNFCFALAYPTEYRHVQSSLRQYKKGASGTIARIGRKLKENLQEYPCIIEGRFKEPFSVYKKLQSRQRQSILSINDIFACRIIVESNKEDDCFVILHTLHDLFSPDPLAFKDYISIPKINGYQSLHTVLRRILPDLDMPVEVQIRTTFMDKVAEEGFASHWVHKREHGKPILSSSQKDFLRHIVSISSLPRNRYSLYCIVNDAHILRLTPGTTLKTVPVNLGITYKNVLWTVNAIPQEGAAELKDGDEIHYVLR